VAVDTADDTRLCREQHLTASRYHKGWHNDSYVGEVHRAADIRWRRIGAEADDGLRIGTDTLEREMATNKVAKRRNGSG
jgi:hypothetical protein